MRKYESIASCHIHKGVEFDSFKIWIMNFFPQTKKFNGATATHPILDNIFWFCCIFISCNVGYGNIVFTSLCIKNNLSSFDYYCFIFYHTLPLKTFGFCNFLSNIKQFYKTEVKNFRYLELNLSTFYFSFLNCLLLSKDVI